MRSPLIFKIVIVFSVLLAIWFFIRIVRFLLPMLLIAIVIGYLWDWSSGKGGDKYDDYDEV
ncbi:MAG: hypothetical protein AB8B74_11115 [Crocinitomicaceae bacterium]